MITTLTLLPVASAAAATGIFTFGLVKMWNHLIRRDVEIAEALLKKQADGVREREEENRRAGESRTILVKEVNHRTKNLLAVVTAILRLSRNDDREAFLTAVLSRVESLARTHTMLAENGWDDTQLATVVERELSQYLREAAEDRIVVSGGFSLLLDHTKVQPLALVLHELGLNARLYGALSVRDGKVQLRWFQRDSSLCIVWKESGGPIILFPPSFRGFGTKVIDATVKAQLHGVVEREWAHEGLICRVTIPMDGLGDPSERRNVA